MLFGKKKEKEQRSVLEEEQMQSPFRTIIKNLLDVYKRQLLSRILSI